MLLQPNGQPPGMRLCAPHGGHDALKPSQSFHQADLDRPRTTYTHATTSYRAPFLVANLLHDILKEEHGQSKKQERKQRTRRKGSQENSLVALRDALKQAYQPVHKVWLVLKLTLEWEARQQFLPKLKPPRKHQSTQGMQSQAQAQRK